MTWFILTFAHLYFPLFFFSCVSESSFTRSASLPENKATLNIVGTSRSIMTFFWRIVFISASSSFRCLRRRPDQEVDGWFLIRVFSQEEATQEEAEPRVCDVDSVQVWELLGSWTRSRQKWNRSGFVILVADREETAGASAGFTRKINCFFSQRASENEFQSRCD